MDCFRRWRSWLRPVVFCTYFLVMCVVLPLCVYELHSKNAQTHVQAWFIGGCFVFMTIPLSLWSITQHIVNYTRPDLQKHLIRVLWMVPIYAVDSWLALYFPRSAIYIDTLRECYEAYAIYSFLAFLLAYLDHEYNNFEATVASKPQMKHLIPFCWLTPWKMGKDFIHKCRQGVLSYTVVRTLTTLIALCTEWAGEYDEGNLSFKNGWSYIAAINNFSQLWAMYCLVLFYKNCHEELKPMKPFGKFLCVKMVVFASFWQAVLIAFLVKVGVISEKKTWEFYTIENVSNGIQNFCICIEMFIAAVAHYYVFSHKPYIDPNSPPVPCCTSFMAMWDISDVGSDMVEHVRFVGNTVRGKVIRTLPREAEMKTTTERTPLLFDTVPSGGESENEDSPESRYNMST